MLVRSIRGSAAAGGGRRRSSLWRPRAFHAAAAQLSNPCPIGSCQLSPAARALHSCQTQLPHRQLPRQLVSHINGIFDEHALSPSPASPHFGFRTFWQILKSDQKQSMVDWSLTGRDPNFGEEGGWIGRTPLTTNQWRGIQGFSRAEHFCCLYIITSCAQS